MYVGSAHRFETVIVINHFVEVVEVQRQISEVRTQTLYSFEDGCWVHDFGDDIWVEIVLFPGLLVGTKIVLLFYQKITFVERIGYPRVTPRPFLHMDRNGPLFQPKLAPLLLQLFLLTHLKGRTNFSTLGKRQLIFLYFSEKTKQQILKTFDGAIGVGAFGIDEWIVKLGFSGIGKQLIPVLFEEEATENKVHVPSFVGELTFGILDWTDVGIIIGIWEGRVPNSMSGDALDEDQSFGEDSYAECWKESEQYESPHYKILLFLLDSLCKHPAHLKNRAKVINGRRKNSNRGQVLNIMRILSE